MQILPNPILPGLSDGELASLKIQTSMDLFGLKVSSDMELKTLVSKSIETALKEGSSNPNINAIIAALNKVNLSLINLEFPNSVNQESNKLDSKQTNQLDKTLNAAESGLKAELSAKDSVAQRVLAQDLAREVRDAKDSLAKALPSDIKTSATNLLDNLKDSPNMLKSLLSATLNQSMVNSLSVNPQALANADMAQILKGADITQLQALSCLITLKQSGSFIELVRQYQGKITRLLSKKRKSLSPLNESDIEELVDSPVSEKSIEKRTELYLYLWARKAEVSDKLFEVSAKLPPQKDLEDELKAELSALNDLQEFLLQDSQTQNAVTACVSALSQLQELKDEEKRHDDLALSLWCSYLGTHEPSIMQMLNDIPERLDTNNVADGLDLMQQLLTKTLSYNQLVDAKADENTHKLRLDDGALVTINENLMVLRRIKSALGLIDEFKQNLSKVFHNDEPASILTVANQALQHKDPIKLLKDSLEISDKAIIKPLDIRGLFNDIPPLDPTTEVLQAQLQYKLFNNFEEGLFVSDSRKSRLLDASQALLDLLIDREDEYLMSLEDE